MLAITHVDKVTATDQAVMNEIAKLGGSDDNKIQQKIREKLKQDKIDFVTKNTAKELKMENVWQRMVQLSNYSVDTSMDENREIKRNHKIDKDMCKLWNKMIQPQYYTHFEKK